MTSLPQGRHIAVRPRDDTDVAEAEGVWLLLGLVLLLGVVVALVL